MTELLVETKSKGTSLAVLKPTEVIDFIWADCDREWNKTKMDAVIANQAQGSLFDVEETKEIFKVVKNSLQVFLRFQIGRWRGKNHDD